MNENDILSCKMTHTIAIVGGGRVGRALGHGLRAAGWRIGAVTTRSEASARAAVRAIGAGKPQARLSRGILRSQVVLIATPDDSLRAVASELARMGKKEWRGKVILHTSGALGHAVLAPLARWGADTGSMHPLQAFGRSGRPPLEGIVFAISGNRRALATARRLARALGGVPVRLREQAKPAYHASGVLVAGHLLALIEAATRILMSTGFTRRRAKMALLPLLGRTVANFERTGAEGAWTGPVARRDFSTMERHRRVLAKWPPEFLASYAALARLSARLFSADPARALRQLDRVLPKH